MASGGKQPRIINISTRIKQHKLNLRKAAFQTTQTLSEQAPSSADGVRSLGGLLHAILGHSLQLDPEGPGAPAALHAVLSLCPTLHLQQQRSPVLLRL